MRHLTPAGHRQPLACVSNSPHTAKPTLSAHKRVASDGATTDGESLAKKHKSPAADSDDEDQILAARKPRSKGSSVANQRQVEMADGSDDDFA